ncbi:MAG: PIN domain-containing protein [Acidobacteria bacterium]|nr:PIN domain-containing protein [Acidobacteriota bacterium]
MIVADTGAILALIDRSDRHHRTLRALYERNPAAWVLPWAILPEVDYLVAAHVGPRAQEAFLADLADGGFHVSWGDEADLDAARALSARYAKLRIGLVDAVVIATAVRLKASAIATLDLRHFAAVAIPGRPELLPRDLV